MTLQPGQLLAHYRLVEQIGEGGMGVVWKATDTTLGRDVAIKVLPDLFAADGDRTARFEREAKLLAALNHPSIATIHGLHLEAGVRFLAMELVAGTDLAERLKNGPLPIEEALGIAQQVAGALEAAHEQGIVHRDLKPGNIMVAPDGTVKVLDFGLARAFMGDSMSPMSSMSPTLTTPATLAGVILGTAAYMSPEQAKGKVVDRRADIWAYGCVLYEMLTGSRLFTGDGISEVLAAVIMAPVDLSRTPAATPPPLSRLLRRCLERDPKRRLRDIGEARIVIEDIRSGTSVEKDAVPTTAAALRGSRLSTPLAAGLVVIGLLAGAALFWVMANAFRSPARPASLRKFEIASEGPWRSRNNGALLALSPDGSRVAFVEKGKVKIRRLDRIESKEVVSSGEPFLLFWSPDSAWLGFATAGKLWKVSSEGGEATILASSLGEMTGGSGASWGPSGKIVLTRGDTGLNEMDARGGDLKTILEVEKGKENDFHHPSWLPDGSGVLFVVHGVAATPDRIALLAGTARKEILHVPGQNLWYPSYSNTGHIIYGRGPANAGIWALPFSLKSHEVTGPPFLVAPEGDVPSVSTDGTLVYSREGSGGTSQLGWLSRQGEIVGKVGAPQESWPFPELSPDGRLIAIAATEGETHEIWIHDLERGTKSRLTFDGKAEYGSAFWSASGDRILYSSGGNWPFSLRMKAVDGSGEESVVAPGWGGALSPDGRYVIHAHSEGSALQADLWMRDLQSGGDATPFLKGQETQIWPRVSPDGRYVAYSSDEGGRTEIYLKRFPSGEGRWQLSNAGGYWPRWSRRGDRLYYAFEDALMEVDVSLAGESPKLGNPKVAVRRPPLGRNLILGWPPGFDVSPDGERFLVALPVDLGPKARSFLVVENWFSEFSGSQ